MVHRTDLKRRAEACLELHGGQASIAAQQNRAQAVAPGNESRHELGQHILRAGKKCGVRQTFRSERGKCRRRAVVVRWPWRPRTSSRVFLPLCIDHTPMSKPA